MWYLTRNCQMSWPRASTSLCTPPTESGICRNHRCDYISQTCPYTWNGTARELYDKIQYIHHGTYTTVYASRYIHYSTCTTVHALRYIHYSTYTTIRTLQYMHYSTYTTVHTLQYTHYSKYTTVCILHNIHYGAYNTVHTL